MEKPVRQSHYLKKGNKYKLTFLTGSFEQIGSIFTFALEKLTPISYEKAGLFCSIHLRWTNILGTIK